MALLQTTGFNELVYAKHGYTLYNKNDRYIGKSIETYGEFSELELSLFEQICKSGSIMIDVGANIGTHTMALSKLVGQRGRVYAFEPQRIVFQTLCANMALNSLTNVETFQVAVSDTSGTIMIPEIDYAKENNFGGIALDGFTQGRKVPKVRLDDFLELGKLDFMKIDVEGMEQGVIEGATNLIEKFKPILYVENDRVEKSDALIACIKALGYNIYMHNPRLFNPDNYANNPNNIFGNIVSKNILCVHQTSSLKVDGFQPI